jgi:glycosyltransferase involved in cell wall biosynthesis
MEADINNKHIQVDNIPKVSIGMPTYNRPQGLKRALKGIVEQTYQNLEVIVSDNASPGDEVETVVCEFMLCDARIQYYQQAENFGPEYNFQFVLDRATGDFFMWTSDDDWRAPQ